MDRDKVIKGLELCLGSIDSAGCPEECPYYEACQKYENYAVFQPLMRDALEALKAQEPVKPKKVKGYKPPVCTLFDYECENCESPIMEKQPFCAGCGKALKWDAAD